MCKACLNLCVRWVICLIALAGKSGSVANLAASWLKWFLTHLKKLDFTMCKVLIIPPREVPLDGLVKACFLKMMDGWF